MLERAAAEIDPTLARPDAGRAPAGAGRHPGIEKKLVQHLKRRQETELGQIAPGAHRRAARRQAAGAGPDGGAVPRALRARAARRSSPTAIEAWYRRRP